LSKNKPKKKKKKISSLIQSRGEKHKEGREEISESPVQARGFKASGKKGAKKGKSKSEKGNQQRPLGNPARERKGGKQEGEILRGRRMVTF